MRFRDRVEAGRQLAGLLAKYREEEAIVLALPRGGVMIGEQIASALGAPLEVLVVRKLGVPWQPEAGMGALSEGGGLYLNPQIVELAGVSEREIQEVAAKEAAEVQRRVRRYRGGRPFPDVRGKTAILVDDGIATGGTVRAGLDMLRQRQPKRIVLATPVLPADTADELSALVDDLVYVTAPHELYAIGAWYDDFRQVEDEEVVATLERTRQPAAAAPRAEAIADVHIEIQDRTLEGMLAIPPGAQGLVIFAHGSGSSRHSPRNQFVARTIRQAGVATLLFDLLTREEEREDAVTGHLRFDIELLAERLAAVTDWAMRDQRTKHLRIGYFGSSTGAAAALIAAGRMPQAIGAVVSRGGRPDMAKPSLREVRAPTLLIVGGDDTLVLELNQQAYAQLPGHKELQIIPGASHLFEEPGALEEVARLAAQWFAQHLGAARAEERVAPEGPP